MAQMMRYVGHLPPSTSTTPRPQRPFQFAPSTQSLIVIRSMSDQMVPEQPECRRGWAGSGRLWLHFHVVGRELRPGSLGRATSLTNDNEAHSIYAGLSSHPRGTYTWCVGVGGYAIRLDCDILSLRFTCSFNVIGWRFDMVLGL